jgi:hypothetical protein
MRATAHRKEGAGMTRIAVAVAAAGFCAALAQPAAAQDQTLAKKLVSAQGHIAPNSPDGAFEATLTFDREVQVPGASLPPGTYQFTQTSATTMAVTNEDRTKTYASFSTVEAPRSDGTTSAQLKFERLPNGTTRLIALYPAGGASGYSPVFKKSHHGAGEPAATSGNK